MIKVVEVLGESKVLGTLHAPNVFSELIHGLQAMVGPARGPPISIIDGSAAIHLLDNLYGMGVGTPGVIIGEQCIQLRSHSIIRREVQLGQDLLQYTKRVKPKLTGDSSAVIALPE